MNDDRLTLGEFADLFERILPYPPDPMPKAGTDAWYCWQATLHNAQIRGRPLRVVQVTEPTRLTPDEPQRIIRVECNWKGRGIRVIR